MYIIKGVTDILIVYYILHSYDVFYIFKFGRWSLAIVCHQKTIYNYGNIGLKSYYRFKSACQLEGYYMSCEERSRLELWNSI